MRTPTKDFTITQNLAASNCLQHPVKDASFKQKSGQKYIPDYQQTGFPETSKKTPPHAALPIRGGKIKTKAKTYLLPPECRPSHSQNEAYINPLVYVGQKSKARRNITLKPRKRRSQTQ